MTMYKELKKNYKKMFFKNSSSKGFKEEIYLIFKGFLLGVVCLIPGISAGTIALLLGIYDKIIFSITSLKRQSFIFLFYISLGSLIGILLFAKAISLLLMSFPIPVYFAFIGFILASLPRLFQLIDKDKKSFFLVALSSLCIFIFLLILPRGSFMSSLSAEIFFISGFLSVFASVLPGLSGSTVLLLLGAYSMVLNVLAKQEVFYLSFFVFGGIFGLGLAFYFVRWFLKYHKNVFFCIILGWIIGSIPEMIPWDESPFKKPILVISSLLVSMLVVFILDKKFFKKK